MINATTEVHCAFWMLTFLEGQQEEMLGTYVLREQIHVSEGLLLLKDQGPWFLCKIMKTNKVFHGLSSSSLSSEEQSWASRKTEFCLGRQCIYVNLLGLTLHKIMRSARFTFSGSLFFVYLPFTVYSFHPWEIDIKLWHPPGPKSWASSLPQMSPSGMTVPGTI